MTAINLRAIALFTFLGITALISTCSGDGGGKRGNGGGWGGGPSASRIAH